MTDTSAEFNWGRDDSIVVRCQPSLAVYSNEYGQVVIRREASWNEAEDSFVYIARDNVLTIIGAILEEAEMTDVRLYRQNEMACHDIEMPTRADRIMPSRQVSAEAMPRVRASSREERRQLIAEAIRQDRESSNRAIAAQCGVSDKTVGAVRASLDAEFANTRAEFPHREEGLRLVAAE